MSSAKDLFIEIAAGDALFKEGEPGTALYIIESGQVELTGAGGEVLLTLGPGDSCGEASLLKQPVQPCSAWARSRTRALRITSAALPDVLRHNVDVGVALLRKLAERQCAYELRLGERGSAGEGAAPAKAAAGPGTKGDKAAAPRMAKAAPSPPDMSAAAPASPAPALPAAIPDAAASAKPAAAAAPVAPAHPPVMALRVVASGQLIALDPARSEFLVGRPDPATGVQPEIDLGPFDANRMLSRRHALIVRDGSAYRLREDNPTTNGTYLNGERVQAGVALPLAAGDVLRFGSIEVEFVAAQEAP